MLLKQYYKIKERSQMNFLKEAYFSGKHLVRVFLV